MASTQELLHYGRSGTKLPGFHGLTGAGCRYNELRGSAAELRLQEFANTWHQAGSCRIETEWMLDQLSRGSITYASPPLVEVALSVQFEAPKQLNQAHLGAFWVTQKDDLPVVRAVEPISAVTESFGDQGQWLPPSLRLALTNEPHCRLQMISSDDQWMYQVQRDRLVVNWRKRGGSYPRYGVTWERFQNAWRAWTNFLAQSEMGPPQPNLWELTYVNRVVKGSLWESPSDWPEVFPGLWGGPFAPVANSELRGFQGRWIWESASPRDRLYIEPKPSRTRDTPNEPPQDVLLLTLTCRGSFDARVEGDATGHSLQDIKDGMDYGHVLIVETFDDLASMKAKAEWRRK